MRKALLILFLVAAPSWAEDYAPHQDTARDDTGAVLANPLVTVFLEESSTLATLWSDAGTTSLPNPFTANASGFYSFYVAPGRYRIVVTKVGTGTWDIDNIAIGTQPHGALHEGTDTIDLSSVTGTLADPQNVAVEDNDAAVASTTTLNFLDTAVAGWTITDNAGQVDISIDPTAIPEASLSLNFPTHSNTNDPSSGQKSALTGTFGTPGGSNRYVTETDSRMTDARAPSLHASDHASGGSDPVSIDASQISDQGAGTDITVDLEEEAHATEHADGGTDELDVTGLSGLLGDPQSIAIQREGMTIGTRDTINFTEGGNSILTLTDNPGNGSVDVQVDVLPIPVATHSNEHEDGGTDEINVAGLSGLLADPQTPATHASSHEDGGADEINVAGLSGALADPQPLTIKKDGVVVGTQSSIDFITGTNTTLVVTDDTGNNDVNVTVDVATVGPTARAHVSGSIGSINAWNDVSWLVETEDTDSMVDFGSSTSDVTIQTAGHYIVSLVYTTGHVGDGVSCRIYLNGTIIARGNNEPDATGAHGDGTACLITFTRTFAVNDDIKAGAYVETGEVSFISDATVSPFMTVVQLQ